MTLTRLLYTSRCVLSDVGSAREVKLREIAARSSKRNAENQLTGALLHVNDAFVQVIEGPVSAVERTFEAICCDFRHEDIKLIDLVPAKERLFGDWDMAFLNAEGETALKTHGDLEEIRFLVGVNAREAINGMRHLLKQSVA